MLDLSYVNSIAQPVVQGLALTELGMFLLLPCPLHSFTLGTRPVILTVGLILKCS